MNVVVLEVGEYEERRILGVFSSEEKAIAYYHELPLLSDDGMPYYMFASPSVTSWEVDSSNRQVENMIGRGEKHFFLDSEANP